MKTMILSAAAVIALGVGVAGSAFAEGEGGSATGAVQWQQADSSTAPATNPTAKIQLAYVQAPFHASEDNGQGKTSPQPRLWQAPPANAGGVFAERLDLPPICL